MAKLTRPQRTVLDFLLAAGGRLSYDSSTGSVLCSDMRFTIGVRLATFNAMSLRGLIAKQRTEGTRDFYTITAAGRVAQERS